MLKRFFAMLVFTCLLVSLTGCNSSIRDTVEGKDATLPPLRIDSSLVCSVTSIDGNRCELVVLEGNNNYDTGDTVYVTYETVARKLAPHNNDVITFTYNYVTSVSSYNGEPHIQTEEITILDDYVPPKTTEETTAE